MGTSCHAADALWRVADQPELRRALDKAPVLHTESLGEPARGVNVWERWLVPNLDGKTWDVLQIYFKEYYGPTWLYAIDLGTGRVKKQRLPDGHQFYLSGRALGFDGKFYIATPSRRTRAAGRDGVAVARVAARREPGTGDTAPEASALARPVAQDRQDLHRSSDGPGAGRGQRGVGVQKPSERTAPERRGARGPMNNCSQVGFDVERTKRTG